MGTLETSLSLGLSIVIVSFNESERLHATLSSIPLGYSNVEVILVVPKSDLETRLFIDSYQFRRVRIVSDNGKGIYPAMNIGLSHSSFTHILFLNTGDLITGEVQLADCLSEINKNPDISLILPVVASWSKEINNSTPDLLQFILGVSGSYVSHQGVLFTRTFLQRIGRFDTRLKVASDFKLLCQLLKKGNYKKFGTKLVSIEYPKFSSKYNRRGRLETFFIILMHVSKFHKIESLKSRLVNEYKSFLKKFS